MLIVLEGPDGAGKTTLANEIIKQSGANYLHATARYHDRMPTYNTALMFHALSRIRETGKPCILDRWWPLEYVYSRHFRGGTKFPHFGRILDRMLMTFGGIYVICLPSDRERYRRRFEELVASGREKFTDVEKMMDVRDSYLNLKRWDATGLTRGKLCGGYFDVFTRDFNPYYRWFYDFGRTDVHLQAAAILDRVDCNKWFANQFVKFPTSTDLSTPIVGCPTADVLLVGDRPNQKWGTHRPLWPFFEFRNCSGYLAGVLDDLKVPETRLLYANIHQPGGLSAISDYLYRGRIRTVVTFGNDATATFRANFYESDARFNHVKCVHPQAGRRFRSYDVKLRKTLSEVLNG